MTINQETLAKRLREARENAGVTQEQAAQALRVPRTAIVQLEAGNRAVSSLELMELARLYERRIDSFFEEHVSSAAPETSLKVLYRAADGANEHPATHAQLNRTIELCRIAVELNSLLGRKPHFIPPAYSPPTPSRKLEAVEQGCHAAAEERKRLELGDAPIADLADLICGQEILASAARFPDNVSGVFLNDAELGMVILVNQEHCLARRRFSYAHEYAHAIFDRSSPVTISKFENRSDLAEVRANAFAAAFLLPAGGVATVLRFLNKGTPSRTYALVYDQATQTEESPAIQAEERAAPRSQTITFKEVAQLAHQFGVSFKAAAYRIRNLHWVTQTECETMITQEALGREYLSLLKLTDYESPDLEPERELPNLVAYRAIEAFRREEISRGRLLELGKLLDMPGQKLLRLAADTVEA